MEHDSDGGDRRVWGNPLARVIHLRSVRGVLLTIITLLIVEVLAVSGIRIPNPALVYITVIVFVAISDGLRPALVSAACTLLFSLYTYSMPGHLFQYSQENGRRLLVLILTIPAIALMAGLLKRRSELMAEVADINRQLQAEVAQHALAEEQLRQVAIHSDMLARIAARLNAQLNLSAIAATISDGLIDVLHASAAIAYLYDANKRVYYPAGASGLPPNFPLRHYTFPDAVLAAHSKRALTSLLIPDILAEPGFYTALQAGGFNVGASAGVLLVREGQSLGLLIALDFTGRRAFPAKDLPLLQAIGDQTALAINNAQLLSALQNSNLELALAYDRTLEGWSRALDLRDRETEGHTLRVTQTTLQLAAALKIGEKQMEHIRRGALLHDIGKMGIPDTILLKRGPLDSAEWEIMRLHPVYAYNLLSPIPFLRPALPIPYLHHERWDGSGYPLGLKQEEIPLEARVFAVVDVWDALRSDRPYRPAWSEERVRHHLEQQAGSHFDPVVVEAFLDLLYGQDNGAIQLQCCL